MTQKSHSKMRTRTLREKEKEKLAKTPGWTLFEVAEDEVEDLISPSDLSKLIVKKNYVQRRIYIILSPFKYLSKSF